jgi:hypothetical protein
VRFSVTTRIDAKIRAACDSIAASEWIDIKYPVPLGNAVHPGPVRWVVTPRMCTRPVPISIRNNT